MTVKSKYISTIEVENMKFYAYHGCYDTEKRVGNHFLVSVKLDVDLDQPVASDKVDDTINYLQVYDIVKDQMGIVSNILEHVAGRIVEALYAQFPQLQKVTVKVSKMFPPLGGHVEKTSVTLTR